MSVSVIERCLYQPHTDELAYRQLHLQSSPKWDGLDSGRLQRLSKAVQLRPQDHHWHIERPPSLLPRSNEGQTAAHQIISKSLTYSSSQWLPVGLTDCGVLTVVYTIRCSIPSFLFHSPSSDWFTVGLTDCGVLSLFYTDLILFSFFWLVYRRRFFGFFFKVVPTVVLTYCYYYYLLLLLTGLTSVFFFC